MNFKKIILFFFGLILIFVFSNTTFAQDEQDEDDPPTRSIISKDFKSKRKKSTRRKTRVRKNKRQTRRKRVTTNSRRRYKHTRRKRYRRKKAAATASAKVKVAKPKFTTEELGVTFWRLRPLFPEEENDGDISLFRVIVDRETGRREAWTAERVNSTTEFKPGDRVRFTIESSRTGYLYIVNREFYMDGTYGRPALIFPTLRTRGGDNSVRAGSLIEIPSASDSVPYFTVKPGREDYAGEELAVIITKDPIPGVEIKIRAQRLTREKVEKWLSEWGATIDTYDAEDGVGIAYSVEEAQAANSQTRDLFQEEPLPQTIYRVKVRQGLPLLIPFQMQAVRQ